MSTEPAGRTLDDLDATDVAIVRMLQEDGRVANAAISRALGVSEPTVRKRIDRIIKDGIIKVTAVVNPHRTGYAANVLIALRTMPSKTFEVGERLAQLERVVYLAFTTGRYDILAEVLFHDDTELFEFHRTELAAIDGIVSTETSHVMRSARVDYQWDLGGPASTGRLGSTHGFRLIAPADGSGRSGATGTDTP